MHSHMPFDLNQLLDVGIDKWLQICVVNTCQGVNIMVKLLFC